MSMSTKRIAAIKGLKPGDRVYVVPWLMYLKNPIGVYECVVTKATSNQVIVLSGDRSQKFTLKGMDFGFQWHLSPEGALKYVISQHQEEIDKLQKRICEAEEYLSILKRETTNDAKA